MQFQFKARSRCYVVSRKRCDTTVCIRSSHAARMLSGDPISHRCNSMLAMYGKLVTKLISTPTRAIKQGISFPSANVGDLVYLSILLQQHAMRMRHRFQHLWFHTVCRTRFGTPGVSSLNSEPVYCLKARREGTDTDRITKLYMYP